MAGVTSKKQLKDEVLKRKENRFLGTADTEPEVCLVVCHQCGCSFSGEPDVFVLKVKLVPRVFRMPQPWSRSISISQKGTTTPGVTRPSPDSSLTHSGFKLHIHKRCRAASVSDREHRYPGGQKVTFYRRAKLERFGLYLQPDGLFTRLTTYQDASCECPPVQETRGWPPSSSCDICAVC